MSDVGPALFKKKGAKKASSLRKTVQLVDVEDEDAQEVFKPKKAVFGQRFQSTSRASTPVAEKKSLYSSDYLKELRNSTPSTPQEYAADPFDAAMLVEVEPDEEASHVDIPEEGMIRHVKEQREIRRRAGENFIPLSDALTLDARMTGDAGKRIQSEDQVDDMGGDGNEGLQGYESDSLPLGARNLKKSSNSKKVEIQELIDDVEGEYPYMPDSHEMDDSSDSDDEWETTQVRKSGGSMPAEAIKGRRELESIPTLDQVMRKLQRRLEDSAISLKEKVDAKAAIEKELLEIAEQEEAIKSNLARASLTYETMRLKVGGIDAISAV